MSVGYQRGLQHAPDADPALVLGVEDQGVADAAERRVPGGAAGGQQPAALEEGLAGAEEVDRRARGAEAAARVVPDAGAEAAGLVVVGVGAGAGEPQHVAGVHQRGVHGQDLRAVVEDPPGAGLGGVLAGLDGLRRDGAAAERHQLRPLAVDQADERGRRVPGRAAAGRSAPRPPALRDVAGLVEPPADRLAAAVEHQQLGPPVAVEVGDVGAEPVALPRLPVGDRRPRLPLASPSFQPTR